MLMAEETVEAFHMTGKSQDCGDKLGYLKVFVEYGLRHETLGINFNEYLSTLVKGDKSLKLVS